MSFSLDSTIMPIRMMVRNAPFALHPKTDAEIECFVAQVILEPVTHTKWATLIVPILKPIGNV